MTYRTFALLALLVSMACTGPIDEAEHPCSPEEDSCEFEPSLSDPEGEPKGLSGYTWSQFNGDRAMVGRIAGCTVIWLTENYAISAAHCAWNTCNFTSSSFNSNNIATCNTDQDANIRTVNGKYSRSNMRYVLRVHENLTPKTNPGTADDDIAIFKITQGHWNFSAASSIRARIYFDGMTYPGCFTNTKGRMGAAVMRGDGTPTVWESEKIDTSDNYCSVTDFYDRYQLLNLEYSSPAGELPAGPILDYEPGDSGGAALITTTDSTRPALVGILHAGAPDDISNEYATSLVNKRAWIRAQDTEFGGPWITQVSETKSLGGQNITVIYFTDSAE